MKKRFFKAFLSIFAVGIFLVPCINVNAIADTGDNVVESEQTIKTGKQMITTFDNYDEICCGSISDKMRCSVNKDPQYISEGEGSMKAEFTDGSKDMIYAYYTAYSPTKVVDIENIEEISVDVYNPNDFPVLMSMSVNSLKDTLCSTAERLESRQWTTVKIKNNRLAFIDSAPAIYNYRLTFDSNARPMSLYLDNMYAIKSDAEVTIPEKALAENEIINFDVLTDLAYILPCGTATTTSAQFSLNTIMKFTKEGNSLNIKVNKIASKVSNMEKWNTGLANNHWNSRYCDFPQGIQVSAMLLKKIDFSALSSGATISVDLYHTHSMCARKFRLTVVDELARSVTTSIDLEAYTWATISLSDFAVLDVNRISSIQLTYDSFQTGQDYNVYVDNWRIVK